ncbi:MAG: hypothetical protein ACXWL2_03650 [Candidatus Chromulinivorax sp.]
MVKNRHVILFCFVGFIYNTTALTKSENKKQKSAATQALENLDNRSEQGNSSTEKKITTQNIEQVGQTIIVQPKKEDRPTPFNATVNADNLFNATLQNSASSENQGQNLDLFSYFLRPINFTKEGITHYFKYTYNHEQYTEYLPYNLGHMIQFLEFGQKNEQNEIYAISIIKLFLQKIKGCDYMNSYSLVTSMPKLADALSPYMEKKEAGLLQELQNSLKKRFSTIFSNYFSYFQKNPDAFLDALSEQIAKKTNDVQTQQHIEIEHIKKDIVRFLETCFGKLIWAPQDAYNAWVAINDLASQAEQFLDKKLLTDINALDDLCWSLIHRFCYFIDIAAQDISQDVFRQIINDIYHEKLILLKLEEQEDLILSKKDFLLKKLHKYCPYTPTAAKNNYKVLTTQTILDTAEKVENKELQLS